MNELLVRLLARGDAHADLFAGYGQALADLANANAAAPVLRAFEVTLLREAGLLPTLDCCADGEPINPVAYYRIDAHRELARVDLPGEDLCIRGATVLAMASGQFGDAQVAAKARSRCVS